MSRPVVTRPVTRFTLQPRFRDGLGWTPRGAAIADFLSLCDPQDVGEALLILEGDNAPAKSLDVNVLVGCIIDMGVRVQAVSAYAFHAIGLIDLLGPMLKKVPAEEGGAK